MATSHRRSVSREAVCVAEHHHERSSFDMFRVKGGAHVHSKAGPPAPTLDEVRSQLATAEHRSQATDEELRRFLSAVGGKDTAAAAKRLSTTLDWRAKHHPECLTCKACAKQPKSHYMHVCCYDKLNRPTIYSCLALAQNKDYHDNHDHMLQTFETAIKCMPPGQEQWVWACDFYGFGLADVNPRLARAFLSVSAEHYPERLGTFLIIGAPTLFGVLWKAIAAFVDPKTHQKIRFLPFDLDSPTSLLQATLDELYDPDTARWLAAEMRENRTKKAQTKAYNAAALHQAAVSGGLLSGLAAAYTPTAQGAMPGMSPTASHDLRGAPDMLRVWARKPELLEPHAQAAACAAAAQ